MRISDWSSDVCSSDLSRSNVANGRRYRLGHVNETVNVSFSLPINDRHALFDARLGIAPPMITQRVQPRRQDQGRWHSRLVAKKRRSAPAFQVDRKSTRLNSSH